MSMLQPSGTSFLLCALLVVSVSLSSARDNAWCAENISPIVTPHEGSHDPDEKDEIIFKWSFDTVPMNSHLLSGDILVVEGRDYLASFSPDVVGLFKLCARVEDTCTQQTWCQVVQAYEGDSPPLIRNSCATNHQPIAVLPKYVGGAVDLQVNVSVTIQDPDEDHVVAMWNFDTIPSDSQLSDGDVDGATDYVTWTPDVPGTYLLRLTLLDGCSVSTHLVPALIGDALVQDCLGDTPTPSPTRLTRGVRRDEIVGEVTEVHVILENINAWQMGWLWSLQTAPLGSHLSDRSLIGFTQSSVKFEPDVTGLYVVAVTAFNGCEWTFDSISIPVVVEQETDLCEQNSPPNIVVTDGSGGVNEIHGEVDLIALSQDIDNDPLSYLWSFESIPSKSTLSSSDITDADSPTALFVPDVPGLYVTKVQVFDGCLVIETLLPVRVGSRNHWDSPDVDDDRSRHHHGQGRLKKDCSQNSDPVLRVESSAPVVLGDIAQLKSLLFDADGDGLVVSWRLADRPAASRLISSQIEGRTEREASFVPDVVGRYRARVIATDGCGVVEKRVAVDVVDALNNGVDCSDRRKAPTVNLGRSQHTYLGSRVMLQATVVDEPETRDLTFEWTMERSPHSSSISGTLGNFNGTSSSFVPDLPGKYVVAIVAFDGCFIASDSVEIEVGTESHGWHGFDDYCNHNEPPHISMLHDTIMYTAVGGGAVVGASKSTDPEGDALTFAWTLLRVPAGSEVSSDTLANSRTDTVSFIPDRPGAYRLQLELTDGCHQVVRKVTVIAKGVAATAHGCTCKTEWEYDGELMSGCVHTKNFLVGWCEVIEDDCGLPTGDTFNWDEC